VKNLKSVQTAENLLTSNRPSVLISNMERIIAQWLLMLASGILEKTTETKQ